MHRGALAGVAGCDLDSVALLDGCRGAGDGGGGGGGTRCGIGGSRSQGMPTNVGPLEELYAFFQTALERLQEELQRSLEQSLAQHAEQTNLVLTRLEELRGDAWLAGATKSQQLARSQPHRGTATPARNRPPVLSMDEGQGSVASCVNQCRARQSPGVKLPLSRSVSATMWVPISRPASATSTTVLSDEPLPPQLWGSPWSPGSVVGVGLPPQQGGQALAATGGEGGTLHGNANAKPSPNLGQTAANQAASTTPQRQGNLAELGSGMDWRSPWSPWTPPGVGGGPRLSTNPVGAEDMLPQVSVAAEGSEVTLQEPPAAARPATAPEKCPSSPASTLPRSTSWMQPLRSLSNTLSTAAGHPQVVTGPPPVRVNIKRPSCAIGSPEGSPRHELPPRAS